MPVRPNQLVKVLSERGEVRLDISVASFKRNTVGTHDSWATRCVLRRLDGPSEGDVEEGHVLGIFSENGSTRLDLGCASIKEQRNVQQESWATRLRIKPLARTRGDDARPLQYDEVVGVFSDDGHSYRLDIGRASCTEASAGHNSWATRMKIEAVERTTVTLPPLSTAVPARPPGRPPVFEICNQLKALFGLEGSTVNVVNEACARLSIPTTGLTLVEKAERCFSKVCNTDSQTDPAQLANVSLLDRLESCRTAADGKFELRLSWPGSDLAAQHWRQSSNPFVKRTQGVDGYEPIACPHSANGWGGLEAGHGAALMNGSATNGGLWFYAVGSYGEWRGAIPGPQSEVTCVELHVRGSDGVWTLIMRQTTHTPDGWWDRGRWTLEPAGLIWADVPGTSESQLTSRRALPPAPSSPRRFRTDSGATGMAEGRGKCCFFARGSFASILAGSGVSRAQNGSTTVARAMWGSRWTVADTIC